MTIKVMWKLLSIQCLRERKINLGGRGATSGISNDGKLYGTEFSTLMKVSNIKFVRYNDSKSAKTPMETMTKNRVYVTVNKDNELKSITYYDSVGKRKKSIDLTHKHNNKKPHTHEGYNHAEKGTRGLLTHERKLVDYVYKIWYNNYGR